MANRYLKISSFAGLDERNVIGDKLYLSPDMLNFTVCDDGSIKKRSGRKKSSVEFNGSVYRMWSGYIDGEICFIVCAGTKIYKYDFENHIFNAVNITAGKCKHIFAFGNALFFICNSGYFKYENGIFSLHQPYVPVIAISCLNDGTGVNFEKPNMLTGKKRMRFCGDGYSAEFTLREKNIDSVLWVKVSGEAVSSWSADLQRGVITFSAAPDAGIDNIEICWEKQSTARPEIVSGCTRSMIFGGDTDSRVFLYGNSQYPNYRYYSELADGVPSAEYFPETNYTVIGSSVITDMVQQYDRQLIFTQDRAYYSYCELRQDSMGMYYPSFPVYNLNTEKGNLITGSNAVIDNTPVTLCADGLNRWVSTTVQDERNASVFSQAISETVRRILQNENENNCCLYDDGKNGELYFSTPYGLYIYNYASKVWYKHDSINAVQICRVKEKLYWINREGELYYTSPELKNDDGNTIFAYWVSPVSNFASRGRCFNLSAVTVTADNSEGSDITVTVSPAEIGQTMNSQTVSVDGNEQEIRSFKFRTELKRATGGKVTLTTTHLSRNGKIHGIKFKIKDKGVER